MSESTETTYHCLGCGHTPTVRNASAASEPDCIRCGTHLVKVTSPTDDIAAMFDAYECCIIARVHAALDNDSGWSRILAKSNQMRDTLIARLASRSSSGAPEDSARLDWLEAHAAKGPSQGDVTICPPLNHGGPDDAWLVVLDADREWSLEHFGPTLRAAIDAARLSGRDA